MNVISIQGSRKHNSVNVGVTPNDKIIFCNAYALVTMASYDANNHWLNKTIYFIVDSSENQPFDWINKHDEYIGVTSCVGVR